MEPSPREITAFCEGYEFVLSIIDNVVAKPSHLNPNIARIINEALTETAKILRAELRTLRKDLQCPPSPTTNPTNSPSS